jgi:hypothetical protein
MAQEYKYTIYFSARDASGVMWCPDCRSVKSTISSVFKTNENQTDGPCKSLSPYKNPGTYENIEAKIIYLNRSD